MGTTKTADYADRQLRAAAYAKALAHPARIAILELLLEKDACVCGDIVQELPISQSTVSQHLRELKEAGLIKGRVEGASVCYCMDAREWIRARAALMELLDRPAAGPFDCC